MIHPLTLALIPAATFVIGYLSEENVLWFPLVILIVSVIYCFIYKLKNTSPEKQSWSDFLIAFVHGLTLMGQLGCVGFLLFWFL